MEFLDSTRGDVSPLPKCLNPKFDSMWVLSKVGEVLSIPKLFAYLFPNPIALHFYLQLGLGIATLK